MQKIILYALGGALVLAALFFAFNHFIYNEKQADPDVAVQTGEATVSGSITAVHTEGAAADGPVLVTVLTDAGSETTIAIPTMGLPLCAAADAIADAFDLAIGDMVTAYGEVDVDGHVVPCVSDDHYFRVHAAYTDAAHGYGFTYRKGPNGYVFFDSQTNTNDHPDFAEGVILMIESEYEELQASDGAREYPPTISVSVYANPDNLSAQEWADENSVESNIHLARGAVSREEVGGADGIRYLSDGLYTSDTAIIARSGWIYRISGGYLDAESDIRADFLSVLDSFRFLPESA